MIKAYSREWFNLHIKALEMLYYKNGAGSASFTIPYDERTEYAVEEKAEQYEHSGIIDSCNGAGEQGRIDDEGEIPIYDKYAHKAVKALFANVKPSEVYVGPAPDKKNERDAANLINEYKWLLSQVFGTSKIDKSIYRALWAFGHENGKREEVKFLYQ